MAIEAMTEVGGSLKWKISARGINLGGWIGHRWLVGAGKYPKSSGDDGNLANKMPLSDYGAGANGGS